MKKLFKLFALLNAILSLLAVCPDYPTIPTATPLLITPASGGMSNYPSSTKQLSITATITPNEPFSGSTFYLFSLATTPPGTSDTESYQIFVQQMATLTAYFGGTWIGIGQNPYFFPNDLAPFSIFLSFDLDAKILKVEAQSENYKVVYSQSMINTPKALFDANTKFYFCAGPSGESPRSCTVSDVVIEYRYYGDSVNTYTYGHLGGTKPSIAAFYPLFGGSLATSMGSASSAYFGDSASNPTTGTSPTWDSSKNLVTISAGQFLTIPLPSISSTNPTISSSFSIAVWAKITNIPTATTTLFSMYSAAGNQVGFNLVVSKSSNQLSLNFGSQTLTSVTAAVTANPNQWNLIGFTAYLTTDKKSTTGNIFSDIYSSSFELKNQASDMDLSAASVIRIGDQTNSFSGQISFIRIMTPGGGIVVANDLCSSENLLELGAGSFALACSPGYTLSSVDNKCYWSGSIPTGTYETTDTATQFFVPCPQNCGTCDSTGCLACSTNFLKYQGACVGSCPDKTYSDGSACQSCSDTNCQECDSSKCLTCTSSFLLYQGGCVDSCPSKTYSTGSACQGCSDTHCKTCDSSKCSACETSYLLYQGGCVGSCPDKTFSDGSACQSCSDTNCRACDSSKCLACDSGSLLYQGGCVDSCPDRTYSTGSACQGCSDTHCKTCDSSKCLNCDSDFLLYQGSCVDSCPSKTYSDLTSCIACSQDHCAQCDADECKVCSDGYQLDSDKKCTRIITTDEAASGVSGSIIAAIVCGSVVTVSSVAWIASRFAQKKSPFQPKRAPNKIHPDRKTLSSPEATNLVSPSQNELNTLIP